MFKVEIDVKGFLAAMSDLEKRQLPFAVANALNDTMFAVRREWQDQIPRVFDRPVPLTRRGIPYALTPPGSRAMYSTPTSGPTLLPAWPKPSQPLIE